MNIKTILGAAIVCLSTFEYAAIYWLGDQNLWQVELLTSLHLNKPWVYRQLVPILARAIASLGIRIDLAMVLVVTAAGVGFYFALRSLAFTFYKHDDRAEILIILLPLLGMIIFGHDRAPYDLTTAWLWTLALLFIVERQTSDYLTLFPLVCLNRETAFLLIVIYAMYKPYHISEISYQVGVYALVAIALRVIFSGNMGVDAWVEPLQNIQRFINHPAQTLLHLTAAGILLWMIAKDWKRKPAFLKLAFLVLAPALTGMYLIFGQAFEPRVFWEIYPILALLMLPTLHDLRNGFLISTVL